MRQSGTVYILTKGDTPALKTGVVQSVTSPVTKFGTQLMPGQFQQDTVIDLTVKVGDELLTFKQLPSVSVIASSGTWWFPRAVTPWWRRTWQVMSR